MGRDAGRTIIVSRACVEELRKLARAKGLEVAGGKAGEEEDEVLVE